MNLIRNCEFNCKSGAAQKCRCRWQGLHVRNYAYIYSFMKWWKWSHKLWHHRGLKYHKCKHIVDSGCVQAGFRIMGPRIGSLGVVVLRWIGEWSCPGHTVSLMDRLFVCSYGLFLGMDSWKGAHVTSSIFRFYFVYVLAYVSCTALLTYQFGRHSKQQLIDRFSPVPKFALNMIMNKMSPCNE